MSTWARWEDLPPEARAKLTNGLGPAWWTPAARAWATRQAARFFDEASWAHHDYGYIKGGRERDRWRCDWLFLRAMVRDAARARSPVALALAVLIWATVATTGWAAFRYGDQTPPAWMAAYTAAPEVEAMSSL